MDPLVIAHRGASGYRPEHTEAAYRTAYRQGADSIELDVVLTRDGVPVVRHDLDLGRTTDIATHPELADRSRIVRHKGTRPGKRRRVWWVHDYDLAELRLLRAVERWPRRRPASAAYDGRFPLLTLDDVIDLRAREQATLGRPLGLHVELKAGELFHSLGMSLEDTVLDALRRRGLSTPGCGVTLMGFEKKVIRRLAARTALPRVLLVNGSPSARKLDRVAAYADAIGPRKELVVSRIALDGAAREPSWLVDAAHQRGLGVLAWTLRAENRHLPAGLRRGVRPNRHGDAAGEARRLIDAGVDALITDFPDLALGELVAGAALAS